MAEMFWKLFKGDPISIIYAFTLGTIIVNIVIDNHLLISFQNFLCPYSVFQETVQKLYFFII